ncbi:AMP-binding protein [Polaribacter sp. MSW13]|uniref:AMP-binding protein n=1 Tax=Polaribacter marinus TaxID=2916838 RepID=A0A9X1VLJ4_9FLAO|nr:AMP-binding protein [Polaribacter marinus]MCI2227737.1 AMP-binding protein [Polaribacter marinus]
MKLEQNNFHKNFQLNGISFASVDELLVFAHQFSNEIYQFLVDWFSKDDFIVVQTSGSTGKPKSISLKKELMINSALVTGQFFDLHENTKALLCLPVSYIAGKMMLVRAMTLGWSIDVIAPNSAPLERVEREYDFSAMVPLQVENSINKLQKIKKLIIGGGVVSEELKVKLQCLSTLAFATYGMTETITHIAVKKLNNRKGNPSFYQILPGVKIFKDERNCLVIEALNVANDCVVTNDVIQLISDTQFDWLGRFDNVINSGGIKLYPEKIEVKLSEIIGKRFFVAGIPDKKLGQKLILIIEGKKHNNFLNNIKKNKTLTKFEQPKEVYFIDKFIETKTKKIQRKKTLDLIGFTN